MAARQQFDDPHVAFSAGRTVIEGLPGERFVAAAVITRRGFRGRAGWCRRLEQFPAADEVFRAMTIAKQPKMRCTAFWV